MREIKFRAWDDFEKVMLLEPPIVLTETGTLNGNILTYPELDKVLMQYTGLKDISMKDVYEGDIIDYAEDGFRSLFIISWYDTKCGFGVDRAEDGGSTAFSVAEAINSGRVIGNIYQNPELLGKEDARS